MKTPVRADMGVSRTNCHQPAPDFNLRIQGLSEVVSDTDARLFRAGLPTRSSAMKPLFPAVLALALTLPLFTPRATGNGGTFVNTSVGATGHLVPQRKTPIALESELLEVLLGGETADVNVQYQIANRGGADHVTYGFPIDSLGYANTLKDTGVTNYRIADGGETLDVRKVVHEIANTASFGIGAEVEFEGQSSVRDWYFSELKFARGERKTLGVTYRQTIFGSKSGTSKSFRWARSKNTFRYTFRPAQTWGDGRVPALRIELNVRDLRAQQVPLTVVSPPGAVERDGVFVWDLKDVDLHKIPDLVVRYDFGPAAEEEEIRPHRLDRKMIESIRASSTLPSAPHTSYGVENLLDGRSDTAWIEGKDGPGKGEWIEITFKPGAMIKGIGVLNGYTKSPAALAENGHVLKLRLGGPRPGEGSVWSESTQLKTPLPFAARKDWPLSALDWVFDAGESADELRKVRLTIIDAVPGTKFSDTAISEIFIYGWKKRKE